MTSPKDRLLRNKPVCDKIAEVLADPWIEDALQIAFAEYCWRLPAPESPTQSWNGNCKRQGVVEFIAIFHSIARNMPAPSAPKIPQLKPV